MAFPLRSALPRQRGAHYRVALKRCVAERRHRNTEHFDTFASRSRCRGARSRLYEGDRDARSERLQTPRSRPHAEDGRVIYRCSPPARQENRTGESRIPIPDYAALAGMSDAVIAKKTGRSWADWVRVLDRERAAAKPHREIARCVSSLGTPEWWTQTVTVGYERIKGLREIGQRRDGGYEASKSRTYNVPIEKLFDAFANARTRKRWLEPSFTIRSAAHLKRMRVTCTDNT